MMLLLWAGAMGVDLGFSVWGSRQAQAIADTAALDVVRYINIADVAVEQRCGAVLPATKLADVDTDNGSNASLTVTPGLWLNGVFSAQTASDRLCG